MQKSVKMLKLLKVLTTITHISLHLIYCEAQFSLLPNIPLFNNNNNFQSYTRAKKSPASATTTTVKCCDMIQVSSDGVANSVLPGLQMFHLIQKLKP